MANPMRKYGKAASRGADKRTAVYSFKENDMNKNSQDDLELSEKSSTLFANIGRVHDWRNYIGENARLIWDELNKHQKAALRQDAEKMAEREDWE